MQVTACYKEAYRTKLEENSLLENLQWKPFSTTIYYPYYVVHTLWTQTDQQALIKKATYVSDPLESKDALGLAVYHYGALSVQSMWPIDEAIRRSSSIISRQAPQFV